LTDNLDWWRFGVFTSAQLDLPFIAILFIYSGYFYSASSSQLLLKGAPDIAWILCQSFTPKRHRQLQLSNHPHKFLCVNLVYLLQFLTYGLGPKG